MLPSKYSSWNNQHDPVSPWRNDLEAARGFSCSIPRHFSLIASWWVETTNWENVGAKQYILPQRSTPSKDVIQWLSSLASDKEKMALDERGESFNPWWCTPKALPPLKRGGNRGISVGVMPQWSPEAAKEKGKRRLAQAHKMGPYQLSNMYIYIF